VKCTLISQTTYDIITLDYLPVSALQKAADSDNAVSGISQMILTGQTE